MKGLLFTYAMTYGGALLALVNPFVGFLIYVCFALIKPDALWFYSVPQGNYSRIVFIALFLGWLIAGCGDRRLGRAWLPSIALAVYLGCAALSSMQAPDAALAWNTTEAMAKTVIPVLIGLTLINTITQLYQLAWVIIISQGYLALEFNLSYYSGVNTLVKSGFAGMDDKSVAISMVVVAALAMFVALDAKRQSLKALAFALAILMIHVPLFTFSRGGMLALITTGAVAMWLIPKRPVHILVVVCAIALGVRLAGPQVRAFFATTFAEKSERDSSAQSRIELWAQAWETILQKPALGLGPGQWGAWSQQRYGWARAKEVHNTWLQTGAEVGIPGVMAFACFFLVAALRLVPLARGALPSVAAEESNIARMVLCAFGGFFVASQFITVYGIEAPFHVALLGLGVLKLRSLPLGSAATECQVRAPLTPTRPLASVATHHYNARSSRSSGAAARPGGGTWFA